MAYIPKQYDGAKPWLGSYSDLGNIVDPEDSKRVKVYDFYDDLYHNRPETFAVTIRGNSDTEIYLPSTKKIVDATARFLAIDFAYNLKGGNVAGAQKLFDDMFKREEINRKFIRAKRSGLTRGDALWHIYADPSKPPGQRISVDTVHPGSYFPIEDADNNNRVVGVHLVDLVHDPRDRSDDRNKKVVRRHTYRKRDTGVITTETKLFEIGYWDDRYLKQADLKPIRTVLTETQLPPPINVIPVYHVTNNQPDGSTFGLSQVSGVEYVLNAINQSITYEDLALILHGLGIYVTSASPPLDAATGAPTTYKMSPGRVIEIGQEDDFKRVDGVGSVEPYQDHLSYLDASMQLGLGVPDMATGSIDVSVAQSGIALALKMGPIIAENKDKQLGIQSKWEQIGYDLLHGWFPAFEGFDGESTTFEVTFGDPMPVNRDAVVSEVVQLYAADLITADDARKQLEPLGYEYRPGIAEELLDHARDKASAATGDMFPPVVPDFLTGDSANQGGS